MKRLLFFDIDGTLTMPGRPPDPETVDAIRSVHKAGHMVLLSTGRAQEWVEPSVMDIGFDGGIFHAGGRNLIGNHCVSQHIMPENLIQKAVQILREEKAFFMLESEAETYRSEVQPEFINHIQLYSSTNTELLRMLEQWTDPKRHTMEQRTEDVPLYKISFICTSLEQMNQTASRLQTVGKVVRFDNLSTDVPVFVGEISDFRTNKGQGMYDICQYLGVQSENCIAFGDSMNGAEILQAAGLGVAMGNSGEDVKQLANLVCESCEKNGIPKALKRLRLL